MELQAKIGIGILTAIFVAFLMTTITNEEDKGEYAIAFWSSLIGFAVILIF